MCVEIREMEVQLTPVISCQLGAKIRERELSGSPVISRFRAKAQTRDFQDHTVTFAPLKPKQLSDNGCTDISRISADVNITLATHQQAILYFNNYASKTIKLHVA